MPFGLTKQLSFNFTEIVSDDVVCDNDVTSNSTDYVVQTRLSCMAIRYSLYVVANMAERVTCSEADDNDCPTEERYQYNTNVVYSPTGQLVTRYENKDHYPFMSYNIIAFQ